MTVTSTTRAVTYVGDDVNTTFSFSFKVLEAGHLLVQVLDTNTGVTSDISSSNYSVTGIGDENGGEVTYPLSGSPLTPTDKITISRVVPPTQGLSITNQGGFFPNLVEEQFDLIVMMAQQYNEELARSLKLNITSSLSGLEVPDPVASTVLQWNANADGLENGPTATEISAAEGYANDAKTSETNAAASASAAATSETNAAASFDSFDDRYLGSKTSDPSTDNDGNALIEGVLYWNSTDKAMKVYDSAAWGPFGTAEPSDGDKDDITVSSGGTVWTIDSGVVTAGKLAGGAVTTAKIAASVVTYAKMQDVSASSRVLGRITAGAGVVEELVLLDEDDLVSDSATALATQQSIKAYVDSSAGGATNVRKTTETQAVNNSTTLVNDDALFYALAANEIVEFRIRIRFNSGATPDIKFAFTVPTGATLGWERGGDSKAEIATSGGTATEGGSLDDMVVVYHGYVNNGANTGNLQLQWAQQTADASDTKVLTNSVLTVWTL